MANTLLRLLRVKQYSKNVFVLAALLFTRGFFQPSSVGLALGAFAAMCLLSSATYVLNDVSDRERDRAHPRKRNRPVASGEVTVGTACLLAAGLLAAGLTLAFLVRPSVAFGGLAYLLLQLAYNVVLKPIPVADVFSIASGFVIRVVVGALALDVGVSGWILLCTGSLALLIGFAKRRAEFAALGPQAATRESLAGYTLSSLDALVMLAAAGAMMFYGVYAVESATARLHPALILTVPVVAYGVCRYVVLAFADPDAAEPETLVFKDRGLLLALVLFVLTVSLSLGGLRLPFLID